MILSPKTPNCNNMKSKKLGLEIKEISGQN